VRLFVLVVPDVGDTSSQGLLEAVVKEVDGLLVSVTVCEPGAVPPATAEKVSVAGVAVIALEDWLVMVNITVTVVVAAPPVIETVAEKVPVPSPVALELTVSVRS